MARPPHTPLVYGKLRRRRVSRSVVVIALGFLCIALYALLSYVSQQPYMQLRALTTEGTQLINKEKADTLIQKIARQNRWGTIAGNTLFTLPVEEIVEQLYLTFPEVAHAEVDRTFFSNSTIVRIKEHTIYARWCAPNSADCYYMTRDGYVFAPAQAVPGLMPWYSPPPTSPLRANIGGEHMANMVSIVENVQPFLPLSWVTITSSREIELHTTSGFYVMVRADVPPADTVRLLRKALRSSALTEAQDTLEYLDARFGKRMFYTLKNEQATGQEEKKKLDTAE